MEDVWERTGHDHPRSLWCVLRAACCVLCALSVRTCQPVAVITAAAAAAAAAASASSQLCTRI